MTQSEAEGSFGRAGSDDWRSPARPTARVGHGPAEAALLIVTDVSMHADCWRTISATALFLRAANASWS